MTTNESIDTEAAKVKWHLLNLLARIHGDGGQYVDQHGLDKAVADADSAFCDVMLKYDELARIKDVLVARYGKKMCVANIGPGETCVRNQSIYCHVCHFQTLLGLPTIAPPPDALALALEARNTAWAAIADAIRRCRYNCNRESYCGTCESLLGALPEGYELSERSP